MGKRPLSNLMYLVDHPTKETAAKDRALCRICLKEGPLTKEHIPPKSAFNDSDRLWDHLISPESSVQTRRTNLRGGFWVRSLCKQCNSGRCGPYAKQYVRFVRELVSTPELFADDGIGRLFQVKADTFLIAKEIATMILAIHSAAQAQYWEALRQFAFDPGTVSSPRVRILAFLVPDVPEAGTIVRFHGRADTFAKGYMLTGGEISMYPFGFVFASEIGDGYRPDRMTDITHWFSDDGPNRHRRAVTLYSRRFGVDAIQTGLGHPRQTPQIDYVGSKFGGG